MRSMTLPVWSLVITLNSSIVGESGAGHSKKVARKSSASINSSMFCPQWRDIVGMAFVLKQTKDVLSPKATMFGGSY